MTRLNTKVIAGFALAALSAAGITACTQDAQAMDAQQIEKQYGVSGAYAETIRDISLSRNGKPPICRLFIFAMNKGCIRCDSATT
jgi:hypothetical protein